MSVLKTHKMLKIEDINRSIQKCDPNFKFQFVSKGSYNESLKYEVLIPSSVTTEGNKDNEISPKQARIPKNEPFLKELHLQRKHDFQAMNDEVEDLVNQCLKAKTRLQAVEDSNRSLQTECRSLRGKYEALLEKNKKDSGVIINLKDSESTLKRTLQTQEEADEALVQAQLCNKQKSMERRLLQNERAKLFLKSQTVSNSFSKLNLKHQQIQEKIERQNEIGKEDQNLHEQESQELRSRLAEDRVMMEQWIEMNSKRDDALRHLQEDIQNGWMDDKDNNVDDSTVQNEVDLSSSELSEKADTEQQEKTKSRELKVEIIKPEEEVDPIKEALRQEWVKKKTLYEVAEKYKDHLMDNYANLNQKQQDLSVAVVCAREWRIDKEAERKDLIERVAKLEQLVTQKRRRRPVPPRTANDELAIWIKVQEETNSLMKDTLSKCLSVKSDELKSHSEFAQSTRETYRTALKTDPPLESVSGGQNSSEPETESDSKN